ncbi:MAG: Ig-like domain-containing protein, partial [Prevotellaceae bacterium]|nr:Ig-like domain-containing protein [Prevotellaceae bacterium]
SCESPVNDDDGVENGGDDGGGGGSNGGDDLSSLTIFPLDTVYAISAREQIAIAVEAKRPSGNRGKYVINSSNQNVVLATEDGDTARIIALQNGYSAVILSCDSGTLSKTVHVYVGITPPTLAVSKMPAHEERNVYIDTYLEIEFASIPTLGNAGTIAIYKADGAKVDEIKLEDRVSKLSNGATYNSTKINLVGKPNSDNGSRIRVVNYNPVVVKDKKLRIAPHYGVLDYNTEYYVTIDSGVVNGFSGVAAQQWKFTTKSAAPTANSVTVDDDGGADFRTIQAAIDYAASKGKNTEVTVNVKNGTYEELLYVRNKNSLIIRGESREGVVITYDSYDNLNGGTGSSTAKPSFGGVITYSGGRSIFLIESADMLRLENLTLVNSHAKTGSGDQAETIYFNSKGRLIVVNCNLKSAQDTINIKGYCWFYQTLISGDVDFIWGGANIALFEDCEVRTIVDVRNGVPNPNTPSYLLQARCPDLVDKGFVFLSCRITKESNVADGKSYLARSSGNATDYDNIAFINCNMDSHINAQGWYNNPLPAPITASASGGWKEYGSKNILGATLNVASRLSPDSYQLTEQEYTAGYKDKAAIFNGYANGISWMQP